MSAYISLLRFTFDKMKSSHIFHYYWINWKAATSHLCVSNNSKKKIPAKYRWNDGFVFFGFTFIQNSNEWFRMNRNFVFLFLLFCYHIQNLWKFIGRSYALHVNGIDRIVVSSKLTVHFGIHSKTESQVRENRNVLRMKPNK